MMIGEERLRMLGWRKEEVEQDEIDVGKNVRSEGK